MFYLIQAKNMKWNFTLLVWGQKVFVYQLNHDTIQKRWPPHLLWNFSTKENKSKAMVVVEFFLAFWRKLFKELLQNENWVLFSYFIFLLVVCCIINLLSIEVEGSVKCFLHIIELKSNNFHENQATINNNILKHWIRSP
jgi:hypothetical protein